MRGTKYENNDNGMMQNLPYEKFISMGAQSLTDSELLAIVIRTGTKEMSAKELGEEVLRVLRKMPKWTPGKHRGKNVRVQFNLPVNFTLEDDDEPKNK